MSEEEKTETSPEAEGQAEGQEAVAPQPQPQPVAQAPEAAQEATFVLPTRIAVYRYQQMKVESILNTPWQVTGETTPFEYCLLEEVEPEEVVKKLGLAGEQAEIAQDLLEDALDGGSVEEIYGPRGGILNILLPTADPEQDVVWQSLLEELEGAPTPEGFSAMPNELFSGMPPGHVWVGTGRIEMALAEGFLRYLWGELKDKEFRSAGMANNEWLSRLRLWAYNPAQGYQGRIIDLIFHERRDLLKRRLQIYEQIGVDCEFSPPEF